MYFSLSMSQCKPNEPAVWSIKMEAKPCKSPLFPPRYPPNAVLFQDHQAQTCGGCGNLTQMGSILAWRAGECLGLHSPAKESFQEWNNLVDGRTVSSRHARRKPALHEWKEAQGYICKLRRQKNRTWVKLYKRPSFPNHREPTPLIALVYYLVNNPWWKHLTGALIRPLVFRWVLAGIQLE